MSFLMALFAVAAGGFIALSYEILWFRIFSFATAGTAPSFGIVLGAYLFGIALGAIGVRAWCEDDTARGDRTLLRVPAGLVMAATVGGFLMVPIICWLVQWTNWAWALPVVAAVAGTMGALLPLISHFGVAPDHEAGKRLSWLYVANIVGSSAGSLVTGLVLLERLRFVEAALAVALVSLAVAGVLLLAAGLKGKQRVGWFAACALLVVAAIGSAEPLYDRMYEKLQFKSEDSGERFARIVETRHGVITVTQNNSVYGGGIYDGVFNTGLVVDHNMLIRAYAIAAWHPEPKRVLMIGLATGSWAQVIVHHPSVEEMTIIEISDGYQRLIKDQPANRSLLSNSKVKIIIDDGRRWLLAHPEERFDAVIINNTWHWRGYSTNLLSAEFHELVKRHMRPGGFFQINTTGSIHVQRTACEGWKSGWRLVNNMVVSDSELVFDRDRFRRHLSAWKIDGESVFDLSQASHRQRLEQVIAPVDPNREGTPDPSLWLEPCSKILKRAREQKHPVLTENNMVIEFAKPWWFSP